MSFVIRDEIEKILEKTERLINAKGIDTIAREKLSVARISLRKALKEQLFIDYKRDRLGSKKLTY